MCLAIPGKVTAIGADQMAKVDMNGAVVDVSLALLDGVEVGDYVIVHTGFALSKLDAQEAEETLALFAQLGELMAEEKENRA